MKINRKRLKKHLFDLILIASILLSIGFSMGLGISIVRDQSKYKTEEYKQITKPIYDSIDKAKIGDKANE